MTSLVLVTGNTLLAERFASKPHYFPLPIRIEPVLSLKKQSKSLYVIPLPLERPAELMLLRNRSWIGCGGPDWLAFCFEFGGLDYLKEPWSMEECALRLRRLIPSQTLVLGGSLELNKNGQLCGPGGSVQLSQAEQSLLRALKSREGQLCDRAWLMAKCAYPLSRGSRALDMAVSRLRQKLIGLCQARTCISLSAIRDKGYVLYIDIE